MISGPFPNSGAWTVDLPASHVEAVRALADEREEIRFNHPLFENDVPPWSDCLIDTSADGWVVAVEFYTRSRPGRRVGVFGTAKDLAALCRSLVGVGRKREREIAGRIKAEALKRGAPAEGWEGEATVRKPSKPRSVDAVARAWKAGKRMTSGNVRTDGLRLYSWRLVIGETIGRCKVAIDYRGNGSGSTSRHCGAAIAVADRTRLPGSEP